ncbi:MAG TPA: hypothetical protein VJ805_04605 [Nitrospiraceae bacterium]|nr:hypothetical protein [Nitrospiraceae bacterium]
METDDPIVDPSGPLPHQRPGEKLPYTPFELIVYGSIEELTEALGGGNADGLGGSVL